MSNIQINFSNFSSAYTRLSQDDSKEQHIQSSGFPVTRGSLFRSSARSGSASLIANQLQCPKASDTILKTFKKSLKSRNSGAVLKATDHGSSGYTLLGNGPIKAFAPPSVSTENRDEQVGIVLKWIPQRAAKDEYACNQLAKAFGLDVPVMQSVSKETSALFVSPTKRQKPSFNDGPFQLIAMNRIDGMNLSQLCLSGAIFALKSDAWQEMMYQFGKAAMLDLFSGNFDRFVRFQMNAKGGYEFVQNPEANAGNVMVHTTPQKRNIASVAFIDNTSLAPPSKPAVVKNEEADSGFSLFGLDEPPTEPETNPSTPPRTPEKGGENPAIVKGLHNFFVSTTEELEQNSNALAEHITAAIKNSILKTVKEEIDQVSGQRIFAIQNALHLAKPQLKKGLIDGLIRLQNPSFQQSALSAVETGSKSLNELIRLNLLALQKNQLQLSLAESELQDETAAAGSSYSTNTLPKAASIDHEDSVQISTSVGSLTSTAPSLFAGS